MLDKGHARDLLSAIRFGLSGSYRRRADAEISRQLLLLDELHQCREIHAYWPRPNAGEIDIRGCLESLTAGAKLFFPVILSHQRQRGPSGDPRIQEAEADGEAQLSETRWGLHEPDKWSARPFAADAAIVPGFGVGNNAIRVGHGWGFYDELLAGAECPIIMPCYDACVLASIAGQDHDVQPSVVVTESRVYRNRSGKLL